MVVRNWNSSDKLGSRRLPQGVPGKPHIDLVLKRDPGCFGGPSKDRSVSRWSLRSSSFALAGVAQVVGALLHNQKLVGSIPSQGTYLG